MIDPLHRHLSKLRKPALGLGLNLGLTNRAGGGGAAPAVAGTSAVTWPTAPTVDYHIHSQQPTITIDGSSRLVTCPDLKALANMLAVSGITAPKLMQDALGRYFLRFNGQEAAILENALTLASNRGYMVVQVGRVHHQNGNVQLVNPRYSAYTNDSTNTNANGSIGYLKAVLAASGAPFLQGGNPAGSSNATDCYKIIAGSQLQVMALRSQTTANGATRTYINNDVCVTAQQSTGVTNYIGAILGGVASAANTTTFSTATTNSFDLYALAFWNTGLSDAQGDAIVAAAVTNWQIAQLDTNLVTCGDSVTDGVTTALAVDPAYCGGTGSRISEPGAGWVGSNVRVSNLGTSGDKIDNLKTKRDSASSFFALGKYPGGAAKNVCTIHIGINDVTVPARTAALVYDNAGDPYNGAAVPNIVEIVYNPTGNVGILQRGWTVYMVANTSTPGTNLPTAPEAPITVQQRLVAYREMFSIGTAVTAAFKTATQSDTGQTYDGLVRVLPFCDITVSGVQQFKVSAVSTSAGYYDTDLKHLRVAGIDLLISGGDNAAYGYASVL